MHTVPTDCNATLPAQQGHIEVVRLLLTNGALATACEKSTGYSAIDVAKQRRASFSYEVPSLCKKLRNALISVWSSTVIIIRPQQPLHTPKVLRCGETTIKVSLILHTLYNTLAGTCIVVVGAVLVVHEYIFNTHVSSAYTGLQR
eukprot:6327-Heterococcus_DN1.PRE.3